MLRNTAVVFDVSVRFAIGKPSTAIDLTRWPYRQSRFHLTKQLFRMCVQRCDRLKTETVRYLAFAFVKSVVNARFWAIPAHPGDKIMLSPGPTRFFFFSITTPTTSEQIAAGLNVHKARVPYVFSFSVTTPTTSEQIAAGLNVHKAVPYSSRIEH